VRRWPLSIAIIVLTFDIYDFRNCWTLETTDVSTSRRLWLLVRKAWCVLLFI